MHVIYNETTGTFDLIPTNADEQKQINCVLEKLDPGAAPTLQYAGRTTTDGRYVLQIYAGGNWRRAESTEGNGTTIRSVNDGGSLLVISGDSAEDDSAIRRLRDRMFFGDGQLRVVDMSHAENVVGLRCALARRCKHCNSVLKSVVETEWQVCDVCASKCEHEGIEGILHGGNGIDFGYFCEKCGRSEATIRNLVGLNK